MPIRMGFNSQFSPPDVLQLRHGCATDAVPLHVQVGICILFRVLMITHLLCKRHCGMLNIHKLMTADGTPSFKIYGAHVLTSA